jgi:hypothetical protein
MREEDGEVVARSNRVIFPLTFLSLLPSFVLTSLHLFFVCLFTFSLSWLSCASNQIGSISNAFVLC